MIHRLLFVSSSVSHHLCEQTLEQAEPGSHGAGNAGRKMPGLLFELNWITPDVYFAPECVGCGAGGHVVCVFVASLLTECTWFCWWGCWRTTLSLCTTSSSPLRALSRRWLTKGNPLIPIVKILDDSNKLKPTFHFASPSPQVHNVAFAFELMQDGGLKKPKARPEGGLSF